MPVKKTSWAPTRKWWASLTGAVATILGSILESGNFDSVERGMAAAAIVSLTAAFWTNNDAPAGPYSSSVRTER